MTRRERIEMAVTVPIGLAFAALLIHMCGCQPDTSVPSSSFSPVMPPCVPAFLSDGRIALASCPDPRQRERVTRDAGWCECPRVVSDDRINEWGDPQGCGSEYVSRYADQTQGYERPRLCDGGDEDGGTP